MTHEQSLALVYNDLTPALAARIEQASNLRVAIRNLPGNRFCFAIVEYVPGSETQAIWNIELPFGALPTAHAHFKASGAFENLFRTKVKATMEHLERMREDLGVEMTIEEAMR